jgi:hypothetical protein
MDGQAYDRLLFDLLSSEHESIEDGRRPRGRRSFQDATRKDLEEDRGPGPELENGPAPRRAPATAESGAGLETQSG